MKKQLLDIAGLKSSNIIQTSFYWVSTLSYITQTGGWLIRNRAAFILSFLLSKNPNEGEASSDM